MGGVGVERGLDVLFFVMHPVAFNISTTVVSRSSKHVIGK